MNKILQLYHKINEKTSSGKSLIFIEGIQMPFKGESQNKTLCCRSYSCTSHMTCDTILPFKLRMKLVFFQNEDNLSTNLSKGILQNK